MVLATHQPIFLPWPGLFHKALRADVLVLLDRVQFPQGRGWMHRNRVKSDQGDHWLRVPVWRTGRRLQVINDVELCDEIDWRSGHLRSLRQLYAHAPYLSVHLPALDEIYARRHRSLLAFNLDLIRYFWGALEMPGALRLQSELDVSGSGTDLVANVCEAMKAETYLAPTVSAKYLDRQKFRDRGIEVALLKFHAPMYPQLWGAFRYNLSALDLLLNCGPKARDIIAREQR
jgi:hypothetical protein